MFEEKGAVSSPIYTLSPDSSCYEVQIDGVQAVMRTSLFEHMEEELENTYDSMDVTVVLVHFVVQSRGYENTAPLASLLTNKGVTVNGYWTPDSHQKCNSCHDVPKSYHDLDEIESEKRKFLDLYCLSENTSVFEKLFGTKLQPFKAGRLNSPQINFGITRGPNLPTDLIELISSITVSKPYSV